MSTLTSFAPPSPGAPVPAEGEVEEEVEGGVDGDQQVVRAHQDRQPLGDKKGPLSVSNNSSRDRFN